MTKIIVKIDEKISKFTMSGLPDRPGMAGEIFGRLGSEGINIHMMAASGSEEGRTDISLTVGDDDANRVAVVLENAREELGAADVTKKTEVVAISLVADDLHRQPGVAGRMFRTLSAQGINIEMVSAANTAVICLIDSRFLDTAKEALTQEFAADLVH
jgi:aspartate kinase